MLFCLVLRPDTASNLVSLVFAFYPLAIAILFSYDHFVAALVLCLERILLYYLYSSDQLKSSFPCGFSSLCFQVL